MEDARQEVPAELIGAEGVAGRARRAEARGEIGRERVVGREPGRRSRRHHDRDGETDAEPRLELAAPERRAHRSRTRGSSHP